MPVVGWCILGININEKLKIFFSNFKLKEVVKKEKKKLKEIQTCPHEISQEEIKKVKQS
jgi:hypothetical protein